MTKLAASAADILILFVAAGSQYYKIGTGMGGGFTVSFLLQTALAVKKAAHETEFDFSTGTAAVIWKCDENVISNNGDFYQVPVPTVAVYNEIDIGVHGAFLDDTYIVKGGFEM